MGLEKRAHICLQRTQRLPLRAGLKSCSNIHPILELGCDNRPCPAPRAALGSWRALLELDGLFLKCWGEDEWCQGAKALLCARAAEVTTRIPALVAVSQRELLHNQPGAGLHWSCTLWHTTSDSSSILPSLTHQLHPKETLPSQC